MEAWEIITLIIWGVIALVIIISKIKKRKKEKEWLLFQNTRGDSNNPKTSFYAINKKTKERKPVYLKQ